MKKVIAIIGATAKAGKELADRLAGTHAGLLLISRESDLLSHLKKSITERNPEALIDTMDCIKDGCWEADIIVLAIPSEEIAAVVEMMREVATQKIVVSLGKKDKDRLEELLPYSKLVYVSGVPSSENSGVEENIIVEGKDEAANKEIERLLLI